MTSVPSPRLRSNGSKSGILALLILLLFSVTNLHAQLELGIRLYDMADYSEALKRFKASDGPTARLYEARSYYQLGEYDNALRSLRGVGETSEVAYTRAIILYASGKVDAALTELNAIRSKHDAAAELYNTTRAFNEAILRPEGPFSLAPRGTLLTIGVLLPNEPRTSRAFAVVQGLVQGILVAVDEFNERNPDVKLKLVYVPTGTSAAQGFQELRTKHNASMVIGPLRSEDVPPVAALAAEHRVPLFIPLANAYTLANDNPYVFRFNPTQEEAGIRMANAAYTHLGLRRIAVLTHPNSESTDDASSFIRQFQSLGGRVVMKVSDARFTDLRHTNRRLDTLIIRRPSLPDSVLVDAVYLPITGKEASTVVDHLLSSIDSKRLPITILGNEELGYLDHSAVRLERFPTYHTSMLDVTPKTERIEQFRNRYIARTTIDPNDFAYVGYDLATFVFETLDQVQHPGLLALWIPRSDVFRGLSSQYFFNGDVANRWLPVYRLTADGPIELTSKP
jgi:ABC-type branched-subunit amino acid transport system substrate-binding protein